MNLKKNEKRINYTLIGLATSSILMFGYTNIYVPNFSTKEVVNIYVANEEIPANVELTTDMFKAISIDKTSYIQGTVTNINEIVGHSLSGKLEAGEVLFSQRISDEIDSDGNLIAELIVPTTIPLSQNDKIRVYVQRIEGSKVTITELFHSKNVISRDNVAKNTLSNTVNTMVSATEVSSQNSSTIYVRLTEDEVVKYQEAVNTGTLYVVKVDADESESELSTTQEVENNEETENYTSTHKVVEQPNTQSTTGLATYVVQDGESMSTIAEKFHTTEDKLQSINNGKTELTVGETVNVPSN